MNDLFYFLRDIGVCNFAYDTTLYVCDFDLKKIIEKLEEQSEITIDWQGFSQAESYYRITVAGNSIFRNSILKSSKLAKF